jgi:hypothetical protein
MSNHENSSPGSQAGLPSLRAQVTIGNVSPHLIGQMEYLAKWQTI